MSTTSVFCIKLLSLFNNDVFPKITLSTSSGNFISITGFLNRLYFTSFEINFNVKLTSFTVLFVQFCLSTDKSTLVCESFILVT